MGRLITAVTARLDTALVPPLRRRLWCDLGPGPVGNSRSAAVAGRQVLQLRAARGQCHDHDGIRSRQRARRAGMPVIQRRVNAPGNWSSEGSQPAAQLTNRPHPMSPASH